MSLASRLGPLQEREFRLLFLGRTISFLGSAFAPVAIAFAILEIGSASDLGLVLAAFALPQVVFMLIGGVFADRLPRHAVMVWSNLLSGLAQGLFAVLILTGHAQLWQLIVIEAFKGTVSAFFFPASQGIVPQTVSADRLQQANAILRLSLNACAIFGAAAAGLVVAGVGPGWALVLDAATYVLAALLLSTMRTRAAGRAEAPSFVRELREGWREFVGRTWLWVVVVAFGFLNAAQTGAFNVLGPAVAKTHLGGPASWGLILTGFAAGLVAGGLIGLRIRPRRALLLGCACVALEVPPVLLLAIPAPTVLIAFASFGAGIGVELFGIYWDTSLQQHVPQVVLSRVSSYDALGSFVLMPLAFAVVGPVSAAVGVKETLLGAAGIVALCVLAMVLTPSIRQLERNEGPNALPELIPVAESGTVVPLPGKPEP